MSARTRLNRPTLEKYIPRTAVVWPSAVLGTAYRGDCACGKTQCYVDRKGRCARCALTTP